MFCPFQASTSDTWEVKEDVVQIVDNLASEDDVTPRSKDEKAREPKRRLAILEIKLDVLASFFWEGRCSTRGTAFIAKN